MNDSAELTGELQQSAASMAAADTVGRARGAARCRPVRALLLLCVCVAGCAGPGDAPFVDRAADSGLNFRHFNGMTGELYFVEMMGSGAGLFDYDNDGDLDVYLVQGNRLGDGEPLLPEPRTPLTDRLYRNDSAAGELRFVDVTAASGIEAPGYGMGVSCGDIDNDGATDLYVGNFGPNQLWRNDGAGRFRDITAESGTGDPRWTVSSAFVDVDRDGLLDLYAGNYVDFRFASHKPCRSSTSARDYCSPLVYRPQPDSLYRNTGDGVFEDVGAASGITAIFGGALGVIAADFDLDGWQDIYVANDGVPNQLWTNQDGAGFRNTAPLAGVAVNMDGRSEASMGVDAGDFDGDGDEDLFMTHLRRETNTLYVNDGSGWFEDRSVEFGLAGASLGFTGFGTAFLDFDNDGDLDLLSVNGAVTQIREQAAAGEVLPLRERNQLFENTGGGDFVEAGRGAAFSEARVSRGAAFGDVDNDGDVDVVINNNGGAAELLINLVGQDAGWLGLSLLREPGGRHDLGARVMLETAGEPPRWRRARSDGSYASCNDPRVLFGLGDDRSPRTVTVHWTDGGRETWTGLAAGRYHTLVRGTGE